MVGRLLLNSLFSIPDARSNVLFDDTFADNETIMIRLLHQYETKAEAQHAVIEKINQRGTPTMNCATLSKPHLRVQCISTGEIFHNAKAACDAHDLCEAHLSNHLNRKQGYNFCKGKLYRKMKT